MFSDEDVVSVVMHHVDVQGINSKEEFVAIVLYWCGQNAEQAERVIPIILKKIQKAKNMTAQLEEPEWKKSQRIESGNYPKSSFVGVLEAIYPAFNENLGDYVLQLDFVDKKTYNIPLRTKDKTYGVHEDGTYDSFLAIGQFLDSLEKIDINTGLPTEPGRSDVKYLQTFWAWLDGNPTGFKTEPDIRGKKLHNIATKRQIGDESQTSRYPDWTIGQIEGIEQPKPQVPAQTAKPKPDQKAKASAPAAKSEGLPSVDSVLAYLKDPHLISEVWAQFGGKDKWKISEAKNLLVSMYDQGMLARQGEQYIII